ncbi:MAG: hypothetical protein HZA22_09865 [Nitrospirae bacterium]|nr:hypothetical protein [Nitrospirota bacterium]
MQGKLRGDEGHSFIGAVIAALFMVLVSVVVFAGQAEMKKDKGGDNGKPKRTIHGNPENRRAVEALLDESEGDAEVEMDGRGKRVTRLKGKFRIDRNKPVEEAALDFIDRHGNAFGLKDAKRELIKEERAKDSDITTYQQIYNGVPVWQKGMGARTNKDGDIVSMGANLAPYPGIDTTPLLTPEEALTIAIKYLDDSSGRKVVLGGLTPPEIELVIFNNKLAYRVFVGVSIPTGAWQFFIDAKDGMILRSSDEMRYLSVPGRGVMSNGTTINFCLYEQSGRQYLAHDFTNSTSVPSTIQSSDFVFDSASQ